MTGPGAPHLPPALADALLAELPTLADEVVAAIGREVPAYARPLEGAFGAGVRRGVQQSLGRFVGLAGDPAAGESGAQVPAGRDVYVLLGRGEARVGRPLDALLAAYRTGARVAWGRLAELGLAAGLSARELVELAATVFAFIDELSAASAEGFTAEQSALAGDRERRRRALAQLLLSDAPAWQVEEAAHEVGWLPPATLTAVLVPVQAGREVASRWDVRALVATEDDRLGALVLLPDVDGPGQADRLERLLAGRPSVVGLPRPWLEARLSVLLVRRAAALADGTGVEHVVDHLAGLIVTCDPLARAELAARRLAPFDALPARGRERLLETLRSWLGHQGDRQQVAAELGIHPQTVRYRVGLLRDLLGADLADPRRRFELSLVLHDLPRTSAPPPVRDKKPSNKRAE